MNEEQMKQYSQIVAKCWADADYKAKLIANPNDTLRADGIAIPDGIEIRVVENSPQVVYVVLPEAPSECELTDEELSGVVGAGNCTCGDL